MLVYNLDYLILKSFLDLNNLLSPVFENSHVY